ncbi:hypothetical protein [Streptomyces sp. NBC_00063]|uniref:hypothetical protein n=1 Tax=Streptomyces sp. NBC_00063 TaxID=2975638 RepID=UPI003D7195F1
MFIVDGTLVPPATARSPSSRRTIATPPSTRSSLTLTLVLSSWLPGLPDNRHDSKGWEESGAKAAVGNTVTIADGGYQGIGLVIPHRRQAEQTEREKAKRRKQEAQERLNSGHRQRRPEPLAHCGANSVPLLCTVRRTRLRCGCPQAPRAAAKAMAKITSGRSTLDQIMNRRCAVDFDTPKQGGWLLPASSWLCRPTMPGRGPERRWSWAASSL